MECSICTESLDDGSMHALSCGHAFHVACICNWFRQGNPSCPNCRDVGSHPDALNWPDSMARASALRRRARNATAPVALKTLVCNVRKAEDNFRKIRNEMHDFRSINKHVFLAWSKYRVKCMNASRRQRHALRMLGTFASPEFPLIRFVR